MIHIFAFLDGVTALEGFIRASMGMDFYVNIFNFIACIVSAWLFSGQRKTNWGDNDNLRIQQLEFTA